MLGIWGSFFQESVGASGGLGVFWNPKKVLLSCLNHFPNCISSSVKSLKSNLQFILINVYGPISYMDKKMSRLKLVISFSTLRTIPF